jgi:hypothetical protein
MAEWSEDHVVAMGHFKLEHWNLRLLSDKMEIERSHLGGPVEHSEGKGGVSAMAILRFLCYSTRLCRLSTEGLVPMSKYWTYWSHAGDMDQVSLVACCQQMFDFFHCFIGWLVRETGYRPTDQPAGVLWIVSGDLFLQSSDSVQLCRRLMKGCHVWRPPTISLHRAYVDWRGKRTYDVGQIFSCGVYIDLNHRDSRIWVNTCLCLPSSSNLLD